MTKSVFVFLISLYQKILSPQKGLLKLLYFTPIFSITPGAMMGCRHFPTCSEYAKEVLKKEPLFKAFRLTLKRIIACHALDTKCNP